MEGLAVHIFLLQRDGLKMSGDLGVLVKTEGAEVPTMFCHLPGPVA
jgi:hypothetical protein